jgi:hypothetical protein
MQATREYVSGPQAISIQWRRDKQRLRHETKDRATCLGIEQTAHFIIGFCVRAGQTGSEGARVDDGTDWE